MSSVSDTITPCLQFTGDRWLRHLEPTSAHSADLRSMRMLRPILKGRELEFDVKHSDCGDFARATADLM